MSVQNNQDIDYATFNQVLEMDDIDDKDFSRGIVYSFFEQAEDTIKEMKENIKAENLEELSTLGHFLKGSSATLGLIKIKDSCEAIQHLGVGLNESGDGTISDTQELLTRIQKKLDIMNVDYESVKKTLRRYYEEPLPIP
ncbi:signal transduction histidine kinase [Tirmania nivea]|nr:signal transduction histidine kinase [Tirmania nivea]